jgi:hypothetical protein
VVKKKTLLLRPGGFFAFEPTPLSGFVLAYRSVVSGRWKQFRSGGLCYRAQSTAPPFTPYRERASDKALAFTRITTLRYGPTVLVSVLVGPMIRHATLPVPSGAQEGEPTPFPPTFSQPVQKEPL